MPKHTENSADTTNIDEVIAYLESPEYLRMIASQQGESPESLLAGSRWQSVQTSEPEPERPRRVTPTLTNRQPVPVQMRTRDGWWEFRDILSGRRPFNTYGALRGRVRPYSSEPGHLRSKAPSIARLWQSDQPNIDYVVYSYNTPIVWHVTGAGFSEWVYPAVRYSRTTSAHQTKIRAALDNTRGGDFTRIIGEAE